MPIVYAESGLIEKFFAPIEPDSAYMTGMNNQQKGSETIMQNLTDAKPTSPAKHVSPNVTGIFFAQLCTFFLRCVIRNQIKGQWPYRRASNNSITLLICQLKTPQNRNLSSHFAKTVLWYTLQ